VIRAFLILFLVASSAAAHDDLAEQVVAVTRKISRDPRNAELYLYRAELYRADGHWQKAEADYKTAKTFSSKMISADLGLGLLYLITGRYQESKTSLDVFITRQPENFQALAARGQAQSKLGQGKAAIQDYTSALRIRPDPEVYIERAHLQTAHDGLHEALAGLDEGIQRMGSVVTIELYAIELEMKLRHFDEALIRVDRISKQSERQETWLAQRGDILRQAGRPEEARKAYREALLAIESLSPGKRGTRYTRDLEDRIKKALETLPDNG